MIYNSGMQPQGYDIPTITQEQENQENLEVAKLLMAPAVETGHRNFLGESSDQGYEAIQRKFPTIKLNPIVTYRNQLFIGPAGVGEILVPHNALLYRLTATAGFAMSDYQISSAALTTDNNGNGMVVNPDGWFYCKGKKSIWIRTFVNNTLTTCEFYTQS